MKKLLTLTFAAAICSSSLAQHTPPRPPRPGQLPPRPVRHIPKSPDQVARDVDNALRKRKPTTSASSHKYVKYNNGKHKGQYKKARIKRHIVRRK